MTAQNRSITWQIRSNYVASSAVKQSCPGILVEQSEMDGECSLGDDCQALKLLDTNYQGYRLAHDNRKPAWLVDEELGGEG